MSGGIPKDADRRRRVAELVARAETLSARAHQVTTVVYRPDDDRDPEAVGSAVLLTLGSARFLVSAAHVLEMGQKTRLYVGAGGGLLPVIGDGTRLWSRGPASPAEDTIDVGIIRLAGEAWNGLALSSFADWIELDLSDAIVTRNAFGLVGYPCTKQRNAIYRRTLLARAYRVGGLEAPEETYRAERVDPESNLIVGLVKDLTWGPQGHVTAPDMWGMSGGSVWRFGRILRYAEEPARLAGIIIQWRRATRNKYMLATRIRPILSALASRYPDVEGFIHRRLEAAG